MYLLNDPEKSELSLINSIIERFRFNKDLESSVHGRLRISYDIQADVK